MAADVARLGIMVDSSQVMTANTALGTMQARSVGVQGALSGMGRTAQRVGGMMSTFITAPLVAAGAAAGKFSSDFQDSLAQAQAQADLTGEQVSFIGDAAEDTAIRTGESTADIIEAYKFTTSAGLDMAESQELVGAAAEASAAGFGEQRDLVRLTTTALQAYDDQLDSSREFMDLLVGSAQEMELEVSKLGPAVQRNVGVAKELGIELDQLMAGIGSVSEIMGDATRGGRMFQTMLSKLLKPSAEGEAAISEMFGSLENLHESIREDGLLDTMVTLRQRLEEAGMGFESVFTGQRGLEAALNFTNREGERTNEILDGTVDTAGALKEAFEESATVSRLLARAWEALKATMRPFGNTILDTMRPALIDLIETAKEAADTFSGWSDETRRTVLEIAALIGAGGPILLALGTLATALGAISWPAMLGVAAFGGATAMIIDNWDEVKTYFTTGEGAQMWETTKQLIIEFKDAAVQLWDEFGDDIISITEESFTIVSATINRSLDGILRLMQKFNGDFDTELNVFEDNWLTTLDKIDAKIVNLVRGSMSNMLSALGWVSDRSYQIFLEPWVEMFTQADDRVGETQKNTSDSVEQMLTDVQSLMEFLRMDFGGGDMKATVVDTSFDSIEVSASDAKDEVDDLSDSIGDMPETGPEIGGIEAAEGSIADLQRRMQVFQNMRELVDPQSEAFDSLTQSITETRNEINRLTGEDGDGFSGLEQAVSSVQRPMSRFLTQSASEMLFFEEETRRVRNEFGELEEQTITLGDRITDMFDQMLQRITETIIELQVIQPLMNSVFGAIGMNTGQQSGWTNGSPNAMAGSYGDALITDKGDVHRLNPRDNVYAFQGEPSEKIGGGGDTNVNVNVVNQNGSQVETNQRKNANGGVDIDVLIKDKVRQGFNNGSFDNAMSNNFNLNRGGF